MSSAKRRKWNEEKLQAEALKYETRSQFHREDKGAYLAAMKRGLLDKICGHMKSLQKPKRHWNKENIRLEALRYETRGQFQKHAGGAYNVALKLGILEEVCEHMPNNQIKWTDELLAEVALNYKTRSEFAKEAASPYQTARKRGILDEICAHMEWGKNRNGTWTKEACQAAALKYETRSAFSEGNGPAYLTAQRNGWLDEICGHMTEVKKPNGYWTKERCQEEALKYQSRSEFWKKSKPVAVISSTAGWYEEITSHMDYVSSHGEEIIQEWLTEHGYEFQREWRIPGTRYRFDFKVGDAFIEYDGEQHFVNDNYFSNTRSVEDTRKADKEKEAWAHAQGFPVYRIPFWVNQPEKIYCLMELALNDHLAWSMNVHI